MNKKAVDVQFNWIFVLIAGAVILAFFFSVVQKQRALSEEKLAIALSSQMDAIFTGAIERQSTIQTLVTPQPGIAFACSDVCECTYRIGSKSTEFRDKILFAPALIKDQDALAWAVEWERPFRIANFLLLTNPTIKYYLIYDKDDPTTQSPQLFARLSKGLPKELNIETLQYPDRISGLTPQGYAETRFIFLSTPQKPTLESLNSGFAKEDVSGLWIDADGQQAIFYEKRDSGKPSFDSYPTALAGDATAYGAMFAADHDMYNCMMRRAFRQMDIIARISAERAKLLQQAMDAQNPPRAECAYDAQHLTGVAGDAAKLATAFPDDKEALGAIAAAQAELKRENDNLFPQSCPVIY